MLKNRVKCATATTGTGTVAVGAAATGFQNFAAAYGATALVQYVIEDGTAWETGRGTYTYAAGAGTVSRTTIEASSNAGAALSLSGSALISVAFLSSDNVSDWPVLAVSRTGIGQGLGSSFDTIQLSATPSIDTHSAYSTSTYLWTCPQAGLYESMGKIRLGDGTSSGTQYGVGVGTANADTPSFLWDEFGAATRHTSLNMVTLMLAVGDQMRLFSYGSGSVDKAELVVKRVR